MLSMQIDGPSSAPSPSVSPRGLCTQHTHITKSGRAGTRDGDRVGSLVAFKKIGSQDNRSARWLWLCDCGTTCVRKPESVRASYKAYGKVGCGCRRNMKGGKKNKTHGLSRTRLYDVHRQMMRRCYNTNSKDYPGYGGRGIKVCAEWHNIHKFFDWAVESGYKKGLTIERVNVNGNYSQSNCTWVPNPMQGKNTRRVRYLGFSGKRLSLSDWARLTGISVRTIIGRLNLGWSARRIINVPPVKGRNQFGCS